MIRIGNATATGDLDKSIIRRYIRRKLPRIKYCYEKQLLIKEGLKDLCISRSTTRWGVAVPGKPDQVFYVWMDALVNYLTGIGLGTDPASFERYWPADVWGPGATMPSFDKQPVRDWLETQDWDKSPPAPPLPEAVVADTRRRYADVYERLTAEPFDAYLKRAVGRSTH